MHSCTSIGHILSKAGLFCTKLLNLEYCKRINCMYFNPHIPGFARPQIFPALPLHVHWLLLKAGWWWWHWVQQYRPYLDGTSALPFVVNERLVPLSVQKLHSRLTVLFQFRASFPTNRHYPHLVSSKTSWDFWGCVLPCMVLVRPAPANEPLSQGTYSHHRMTNVCPPA